MALFVKIRPNEYHDSLEMLLATTIMEGKEGIKSCNVGMGTEYSFKLFDQLGFRDPAISSAKVTDVIIAADAENEEAFETAVQETFDQINGNHSDEETMETCISTEEALSRHPDAQVAVISLPGEYAKEDRKSVV